MDAARDVELYKYIRNVTTCTVHVVVSWQALRRPNKNFFYLATALWQITSDDHADDWISGSGGYWLWQWVHGGHPN